MDLCCMDLYFRKTRLSILDYSCIEHCMIRHTCKHHSHYTCLRNMGLELHTSLRHVLKGMNIQKGYPRLICKIHRFRKVMVKQHMRFLFHNLSQSIHQCNYIHIHYHQLIGKFLHFCKEQENQHRRSLFHNARQSIHQCNYIRIYCHQLVYKFLHFGKGLGKKHKHLFAHS